MILNGEEKELTESEIEFRQGVVDMFLNDEATLKHNNYLQKRKNNVKKELLECEGFYYVYKNWKLLSEKANKAKIQNYNRNQT